MSNEVLPTIRGYRLVRPIGRGSYGSVWEARAAGDFGCAMKFISLAAGGELARPELKALEASKTLNHPNLLQTQQYFMDDEWVIIVMELAHGNLRERLDYCRKALGLPGIPPEELLHYMREAADALDYLHGLNKLHRDIKPDNLLITTPQSPHVKVGDCGLLRDRSLMATMAAQGSPPYIAPEAWFAKTVPASDQFSLATTYVELRTGKLPFMAPSQAEIQYAIQWFDPDLGEIAAEEQEVVKKALAKGPDDRFPSCRDFIVALERAIGVSASSYRPREPIQLQKRAISLPPPRVSSAGLRSASEFQLETFDGGPPPGPVTNPPAGTITPSTLPPDQPAPPSGTMKGPPVGTLIEPDRPQRSTTPVPSTHKGGAGKQVVGTLGPGAVEPLEELVEEGGAGWRQEVEEPAEERGSWKDQPNDRGGVPVGLLLAGLLLVVGVGGGLWYAASTGLFSPLGPGGVQDSGKVRPPDKDGKDDRPGDREKEKEKSQTDRESKEKEKGAADKEKGPADKEKGPPDREPKEKTKAKDGGPPPVKVTVPKGFVAAVGAKPVKVGENTYHSKITRAKGGPAVFLLMRPAKGAAFYVMENKVWNALYREFATDSAGQAGETWKKGGLAGDMDTGDGDLLPVMRVSRPQAEAFAEWMGGRLPTAAELDHAAGADEPAYREEREGPAEGDGRKVAVGRRNKGPRAINEATDDISPRGVRDLSGNGREWTQTNLDAGGETLAVTRGQSYTAQAVLRYADLDEMQKPALTPTQYPTAPTPYTGFRVVIPLGNGG